MWYYDDFECAGNIQLERRTLSTREGTMAETGRLRQRRILITGAASGIGRRTAQLFAAEGAALILLDRSAEALTEVASRRSEKEHQRAPFYAFPRRSFSTIAGIACLMPKNTPVALTALEPDGAVPAAELLGNRVRVGVPSGRKQLGYDQLPTGICFRHAVHHDASEQ
jgi:short subunit dehydrogenase